MTSGDGIRRVGLLSALRTIHFTQSVSQHILPATRPGQQAALFERGVVGTRDHRTAPSRDRALSGSSSELTALARTISV